LSTPLIDAEAAADVVELLLEALAALPGRPRLALLPLLDEEGAVAKLFLDRLVRTGRRPVRLGAHRRAALLPGNGNPFVALSVKKLKELRRQRWRLAEEGTLVREMVSHTSGINAVIADYLALEAKGWKGRWGGAAMHDAPSARLLSEAVASLAAEGKARIDLLKLDGRPIAATIALFSGDRAWFWKTAYDEGLARYSPGVQLALDLSEALGRYRHLKVVDSCAVAGHPMIDHLWEGRLALADWLVPLGGRPSFAAGVAAERVRRAVIAPLKAVRDRLRD
jgi:hypothetical protein